MRAAVLIASIILTVGLSDVNGEVDLKELRCLVCRSTLEELESEMEKIDPKKKIEIGNYRLDGQGNMIRKEVPLSRSEVHISEVLEDICTKMEDYIRATSKTDGKLMIFKIMTPEGKMNPLMSETNVIQDGDLNKSLKYLCEGIVEEHEDPIIESYSRGEANIINKVCTKETRICKDELPLDTQYDEGDMERVEL